MKQRNKNVALIGAILILAVAGLLLTLDFGAEEVETLPVASLEEQLLVPQLNVPVLEPYIPEAGIREFFNPEEAEAASPNDASPNGTNAGQGTTQGNGANPEASPDSGPEAELDYDESGQGPEEAAYHNYEEEPTVPVFAAFEYGARMAWPVRGEVVLDYSTERFIFDPTLNLYRTNAIMSIAAAEGTPVQAAAEGVVTDIAATRREGNKVTLDHGNGWSTTYTQLNDILVSVGDVVVLGEVIAHVGSPTIFSSELGENTGLRITRYNETVNPIYMLSN